MTHGTILLIGPQNREIELFVARLRRENFSVAMCENDRCVHRELKDGYIQSVLFTQRCPRRFVERVVARIRASKKTKSLPMILVTDTEIPSTHISIKGISEIFRLHHVPLSQVVRRLKLAIRLTQLVKEYD